MPEVVRITTASLWQLVLWREPGEGLTKTLEAVSPDLRTWERGCQRDWMGDGSVIEPLELISVEQRGALDLRLFDAAAMPAPEQLYVSAPDIQRIRPKARRRRRRVKA